MLTKFAIEEGEKGVPKDLYTVCVEPLITGRTKTTVIGNIHSVIQFQLSFLSSLFLFHVDFFPDVVD